VTDSISLLPSGYRYQAGKEAIEFPIDPVTGESDILHIKTFHPLSDFYGLSSIEPAAYSIDQHNQAGEWNQSLLQNGARPSGAIVVGARGGPRNLTDTQYQQLRSMVQESFAGARNAGAPIILEGGLEWQEMSLSPKDMDFIETKHSSAREIALALGMPPQLLGIPGDSTYSNLQEARLALWEQTIIPMLQNVVGKMHNWFTKYYSEDICLSYDLDNISALAAKRDNLWKRVDSCSFLTVNEKRNMVGLSPISGGDYVKQ
jgi:HK97 family phage portal protein